MAKPETAERHPRIDHERAVVLALADPGRLDKDGKLQKPTHREIAERLRQEELLKLQGRSRDIKLAAETQSIRDIGRRFIDKVNGLGYLKIADSTRTSALLKELEEMHKRSLGPEDLYEIMGISQARAYSPSFGSSQYLDITAQPLPQPDTDPDRNTLTRSAFEDHLIFLRKNPEPKPLGTK